METWASQRMNLGSHSNLTAQPRVKQSVCFLRNELADNATISSFLSFRTFPVKKGQWRDRNFNCVLPSKVCIILYFVSFFFWNSWEQNVENEGETICGDLLD